MEDAASPPQPLDRDYWLAHCEGYRVRAGSRVIGLVEDVLVEPASGRAAALVVRAGLFGQRQLAVDVDSVEEITPRSERIVLRTLESRE